MTSANQAATMNEIADKHVSNIRPQMMKALRGDQGDDRPTLQQIPVPSVGPQDILIKIKSASMTRGSLKCLRMGVLSHTPQTFGHSAAGEIVEVGSLVTTFSIGDRVKLHANLGCGVCQYCTSDREQMCLWHAVMGFTAYPWIHPPAPLYDIYHNGGVAEYLLAPSWLADKLPNNVSYDVAAKVHELANALRLLRSASLPLGSTVIITAPTGNVGAATIKLASFAGIGRLVLVGRSTERLKAVAKVASPSITCDIVGIDTLNADWPKTKELERRIKEIIPDGADAIIDLQSTGTDHWQVLSALANEGTILEYGGNPEPLPMPLFEFTSRCLRLIGMKNHSRRDVVDILNLLKNGQLQAEDLITHRFSLDDAEKFVDLLDKRNEPAWFVVIHP